MMILDEAVVNGIVLVLDGAAVTEDDVENAEVANQLEDVPPHITVHVDVDKMKIHVEIHVKAIKKIP